MPSKFQTIRIEPSEHNPVARLTAADRGETVFTIDFDGFANRHGETVFFKENVRIASIAHDHLPVTFDRQIREVLMSLRVPA